MPPITPNKIIYQLTVEDLQTVADEFLERELTPEEITLLEEKIGDHINFYDVIHQAMICNDIK